LPGPVVTGPGARPRKLCDRCALGLTQDEVLLRDADDPTAAVARLPAAQLRRLEVIDDGQQLSIHLIDGRQVHLDLRTLRARAPFIASAVTDGIAEALEVPS
ncbi:MAG: hypothetical protein KC620_23170, partial [Myxococcales bacterium]|nr:hypothetical protein [Myxococcales bacterium]